MFVDVFLDAHGADASGHPKRQQGAPPSRIIIDLDATDDPTFGQQEGRHFSGYYDCYCYLPLYIFCGRHLLAAKLRSSSEDAAAGSVEEVARIVGQIRTRWPDTAIVIRADSGFCRDDLLSWCEANGVSYVIGLAGNTRLLPRIKRELKRAERRSKETGQPARVFKDFTYRTLDSWSTERRVVAKAEWTQSEANPRFIVTNIHKALGDGRHLYEDVYCQRGEMENRLKECRPCGAWLSHDAICSRIEPRHRPCAPTSCGSGSRRWPMCSCVRCGASGSPAPGWSAPRAARSGSRS